MDQNAPKKNQAARRKKRRAVSRWTTRQKFRAAGRVGDAALTTVEDVARVALNIVISAILVLLTAGLIFACIFAYLPES